MTGSYIIRKIVPVFAIAFALFFVSCKKEETDGDLIGNNNAPYYDGIPTVLVKNYVNRLYIDLIGREPLDTEMEEEVLRLTESRYDFATRDSLIVKLQYDSAFRVGDSSYKAAYYNRLYELFKVKMLEGASDADIEFEKGLLESQMVRDSIAGDWYNYQIHENMVNKLDDVLAIDEEYGTGKIELNIAFARLLNNAVYDRINMNTFNFLNAAYNDLFGRYPSEMEFENGFQIVEYNQPATVFGQTAVNKDEFIDILINSKEFYEGMIRWAYGSLLAREPETEELEISMNTFYNDHNLPALQKTILRTDEYANFTP